MTLILLSWFTYLALFACAFLFVLLCMYGIVRVIEWRDRKRR